MYRVACIDWVLAGDDFLGKKWNSFKVFDNEFRQYCELTEQLFSVFDSHSVE